MLKNQDSIQEEKSQFQYWEMQNVEMQKSEDNNNKLKQINEDSSKGNTMYQSNELLKKRDNLEEVSNCRKQEGKDDRVAVRIKFQQSRDERNQQSEDLLDREIELIRRIMMKVRKTLARKKRRRQ